MAMATILQMPDCKTERSLDLRRSEREERFGYGYAWAFAVAILRFLAYQCVDGCLVKLSISCFLYVKIAYPTIVQILQRAGSRYSVQTILKRSGIEPTELGAGLSWLIIILSTLVPPKHHPPAVQSGLTTTKVVVSPDHVLENSQSSSSCVSSVHDLPGFWPRDGWAKLERLSKEICMSVNIFQHLVNYGFVEIAWKNCYGKELTGKSGVEASQASPHGSLRHLSSIRQ
ncbi:hypothetical protein AXG93_4916s1010 [Marchantia polymorpha subsp. ruderalis]|uniref:Uncharacterized protein n=1 Tax=Marchantia polymorpha subsp. ruderalis TaxID=1480154 RepID=A0A176W994_MARPO|nr:hypothetical protein AXG93_4916s1010 [Marchantia polymorpha subsp. ruderalis]